MATREGQFMDFDLTEEHLLFQKAIRSFAEKEIVPLVDEAEETNVFPQQFFEKMDALGIYVPRYPVQLGGGGGDKIMECIMAEELNRVMLELDAGTKERFS